MGSVADPGFLKGGGAEADLIEAYRNSPRQNHLSDKFSSLSFKLNPKEVGG